MRKYLTALAVALAVASPALAAPRYGTPPPFVPGQSVSSYSGADVAPLHAQSTHPTIPDSYMVVLKNGVSAVDFVAHRSLISAAQLSASAFHANSESAVDDAGIGHVFDLEGHMQGYAGRFTDDVLEYIRALPEVEYVEVDSIVKTTEMPYDGSAIHDVPYEVSFKSMADDDNVGAQNVEKGAPWGLARVSHRKELGLGTFSQYLYDSHAGDGVVAYIIDTGINIDHEEFEGRAHWGKTMPAGSTDKDGNGHGSHVAGTVISQKYGVAKKAEAIAVKVLSDSGSGSMSDVTGGVLWAVQDAKKKSAEYAANPTSDKAKKHKGFVANMSLGGGKSPTLDRAVNGATDNGLNFAVAAGNENQDACNTSPASAEGPVTVGASTIQDERAYFSNKGKCVDVFGPGLNILSVWNSGNRSTNTISGTSMASPHVCGILAYYLSILDTETLAAERQASATLSASSFSPLSLLRNLPLPDSFAYVAMQASQWVFGSAVGSNEASYLAQFERLPILSVASPEKLKKIIEKVATRKALHGLDTDTSNLLVFNNATLSTK